MASGTMAHPAASHSVKGITVSQIIMKREVWLHMGHGAASKGVGRGAGGGWQVEWWAGRQASGTPRAPAC